MRVGDVHSLGMRPCVTWIDTYVGRDQWFLMTPLHNMDMCEEDY